MIPSRPPDKVVQSSVLFERSTTSTTKKPRNHSAVPPSTTGTGSASRCGSGGGCGCGAESRSDTSLGDQMLDGFFKISERGSTVARDLRAGDVTFFTMAYIVVLNPLIIGSFAPTGPGAHPV